MKIGKFIVIVLLSVSCYSPNKSNEKSLEVISSLEEYLQISSEHSKNEGERLKEIERVVKTQGFLTKFPVMLFSQDTISTDSIFTTGWAMAAYKPTSLPLATISSNDGIDTISFNKECGCFPIEISSVSKGKNIYKGRIWDNGREFIFEGWFYGK